MALPPRLGQGIAGTGRWSHAIAWPDTSHLLNVCDGSKRPENAQCSQGRYVERARGSESLQDEAGYALQNYDEVDPGRQERRRATGTPTFCATASPLLRLGVYSPEALRVRLEQAVENSPRETTPKHHVLNNGVPPGVSDHKAILHDKIFLEYPKIG